MNASKLTWYIARSGGILAWCLLAASLVLGLVLSSRALGKKTNPPWTLSVHRFCGGLAVIFTGIHMAAIMADDFVDFGFAEVLVPWASTWRPTAVAWGVIGMYLLLAIEVTSLLMRRMPKRVWRWVHWSSAGLFGFATLHGFQSGTDAGKAFIVATTAVVLVLTCLVVVRAIRARNNLASRRDPRALLDDHKAAARARAHPSSLGPQKWAERKRQVQKPMRPLPPTHVLDGFSLTTRPRNTPASVASNGSADRTPQPAACQTAATPQIQDPLDAPLMDFAWQPTTAKRTAHASPEPSVEPGFLEPRPSDTDYSNPASAPPPADPPPSRAESPSSAPADQPATLNEALPEVPDTPPSPPVPRWASSLTP